ncbi:Protein mak11 [Lecanora helva]
MGKRKRKPLDQDDSSTLGLNGEKKRKTVNGYQHCKASTMPIQIIVGTYEKVLHGIQATINQEGGDKPEQGPIVEFADTFLLSPHGSAIRCLAVSPPSNSDNSRAQKAILASGSSDQTINLYHISREAPLRQKNDDPGMPTLTGNKVKENPRNRELGSLQHHGGSINALYFPTRSKLLSAAEDNTIAVARSRDWTVLSTIKAPIPKAHGRPSGDTAPLGGTPSGINDFAVHPSMKLMVSVGKGEKCMRLWNLVTGKKAGVLNFERDLLQGVGEGRWASGEGRKVKWNSLGEEFVVAFESGCLVYGMLHYQDGLSDDDATNEVLAISTEDGRVIFYSSSSFDDTEMTKVGSTTGIPTCEPICQLGGVAEGLIGRIKDFEILKSPLSNSWIVVTGSSDGAIRVWHIAGSEFKNKDLDNEETVRKRMGPPVNGKPITKNSAPVQSPKEKQVGRLLGTYEAGNRITCLKAFVMTSTEQAAATDSQNDTANESDSAK